MLKARIVLVTGRLLGWAGLQESYQTLSNEVVQRYDTSLKTIRAIGFSAMMHRELHYLLPIGSIKQRRNRWKPILPTRFLQKNKA